MAVELAGREAVRRVIPIFKTPEDRSLFLADYALMSAIGVVGKDSAITVEDLKQRVERDSGVGSVIPEFLDKVITEQLELLEKHRIESPRGGSLDATIRLACDLMREAYGLGEAKPDVQS